MKPLFSFSKYIMFSVLLLLMLPSQTLGGCVQANITDEDQGQLFLDDYNRRASEVAYANYLLWWEYYHNITNYNLQSAVNHDNIFYQFENEVVANASCFAWKQFSDVKIKREFSKIVVHADMGVEDRKRLTDIQAKMRNLFNRGKVCGRPNDEDKNKCYVLEPGHPDTSKHWQTLYENENFEKEISVLFEEAMELYKPLHTYVKNKLKKIYPDQEFPASGHIPAHILGNNWAQDWSSLINEESIIPYPGRSNLDITNKLLEKNFTVIQIYKTAEEFFMSLGFPPLSEQFWTDSMLVRPTDREASCRGSAWDLLNGKDFRMSFCTEVNHRDFLIVHHELGHIYYFMEYKDQPLNFRDGASPAVHEAIGDLILLSATTPHYLHSLGLLDNQTSQYEDTINYLMLKALENTAFLPFGYLVDQWRWDVFKGKVKPENYNAAWWEFRCKLQGVSPPVARSEDDFDPGAKYHVAAGVPYIRYFLSYVLMFQYQKALCDAAGFNGSLYDCNLFNSTVAGTKLRDMLKLGSSVPFPETLQMIANTDKLSAKPLVEYFKPLVEWLEKENQGNESTWDDECPTSSAISIHSFFAVLVLLLALVSC